MLRALLEKKRYVELQSTSQDLQVSGLLHILDLSETIRCEWVAGLAGLFLVGFFFNITCPSLCLSPASDLLLHSTSSQRSSDTFRKKPIQSLVKEISPAHTPYFHPQFEWELLLGDANKRTFCSAELRLPPISFLFITLEFNQRLLLEVTCVEVQNVGITW